MESQSWLSFFCSSQNWLLFLHFVIKKGRALISTKVHILWCTHWCLAIGRTQLDTMIHLLTSQLLDYAAVIVISIIIPHLVMILVWMCIAAVEGTLASHEIKLAKKLLKKTLIFSREHVLPVETTGGPDLWGETKSPNTDSEKKICLWKTLEGGGWVRDKKSRNGLKRKLPVDTPLEASSRGSIL